jgi:hypothetical protein
VDNVEQKRKVENDDDNETVNTEYKFRAETMADVESLYNILEFRNAVSHMQITKDECFPDVEVTFTSTLSIDEILGMMKNIDDSHVMTGSLDVAEEYTGDRFRDTPIIRSLVTWKLAPIPKEWIVKNNWVKQIVHTPFSVPKVVERPTILTKALDQQTSPKPCCFTYDECLPTCNTQSTSTSTPIFDEIVYDVGVNWCWFYVRCGQVIASFRLHLEDEMCWKFFKLVESPRLFPSVASGTTFKYGSTTRRHVAITKNTVDAPLDFLWLQNFLKTIEVEFRGAIEEEEFVDLYKIDENRLDMQEDLDRLNSLRRQLVLGEC